MEAAWRIRRSSIDEYTVCQCLIGDPKRHTPEPASRRLLSMFPPLGFFTSLVHAISNAGKRLSSRALDFTDAL